MSILGDQGLLNMENIFDNISCDESVSWKRLYDVESKMISRWNYTFVNSGIDASQTLLKHRMVNPELKRETVKQAKLISLTKVEVDQAASTIIQPHLFILTDQMGMTLGLYGTESILETLEVINFGTGASFALEHAGINGISMAMQLEETVIVQGKEHHLQLFSGWSCICMPIRLGKETKAYLDLSFKADMDVTFAVPLLQQIVNKIECQLAINCPELKKAQVYALFDEYQLTCREKEIGYLWLNNETVEDIASKLHITIGTVRNTLKKVYKKTEVSSKGKFLIEFIV